MKTPSKKESPPGRGKAARGAAGKAKTDRKILGATAPSRKGNGAGGSPRQAEIPKRSQRRAATKPATATDAPAPLQYTAERLATLRQALGPLVDRPVFTCWRLVLDADGKERKKPTHPAGYGGLTLDQALGMLRADPGLAGLGLKFGPVPGAEEFFTWGADYDGALKAGRPAPDLWVRACAYRERSPSGGDRFHVLAIHQGAPLEGVKKTGFELYCAVRFFTLTGARLEGSSAKLQELDPQPFYAAIGIDEPQPYGTSKTTADIEGGGAPINEDDLTERERTVFEAVRGIDNPDESRRDFIVCLESIRGGATDEETARILCAGFWRDKLKRRDYLATTIAKAREAAQQPSHIEQERLQARRETFRKVSRDIGEGPKPEDTLPPKFTLGQMLADAVFIAGGSLVALRSDPRTQWTFSDFKNLTAASTIQTGKRGQPALVANRWLHDPKRVTVQKVTFHAGAPLITQSPDDLPAINTWREPPRLPVPTDWRERARPFFAHVAYLVPEEPGSTLRLFLDWLAHIEQRPGERPSIGFLMFATAHGIGRNLLACWLARIWPGVVALDVDLPSVLKEGGFNGRLSRKILGIVNEIREGGIGGAEAHRQMERLKNLITDETRSLNPKFERQHEEFNSCRWLLFSNYAAALPMTDRDRRFVVVENPSQPKSADYYSGMYALANDPQFIASVREALRQRDIGKFNPGQRAPHNEARRKVIDASLADCDVEMRDLVANFPGDCIDSSELGSRVFGVGATSRERAMLRYVAHRAGAVAYPQRVRIRRRYGPASTPEQVRVWILRDQERWMAEKPEAIAREIERGAKAETGQKA